MIYLDNAATGKFKPKSVISSMVCELKNSANGGRASHKDAIRASNVIYSVREKVANSFNVTSDEVAFTSTCTAAMNTALFGLGTFGHVVTTCNEHNCVLRPLYYLNQLGKIKLTVVKPKNTKTTVTDIANSVTSDTKLLVCNHVSNVTGDKLDINELGKLCAKKGIIFVLDAAQSYGHENIDMKAFGIDICAVAGHKGINGPQGIGALVVKNHIKLKPLIFGGTGTYSHSVNQPFDFPEGFESGTQNTPAIAGLGAAIDYTTKNSVILENRISSLSEQTLYGLKQISGTKIYTTERNGVISFNLNRLDCGKIGDILSSEFDIAVRTGYHCAPLIHDVIGSNVNNGTVRVGIGACNTSRDIEKVLIAVEKIAKRLL